jgi:phosphonate transport system substrate-binding protein
LKSFPTISSLFSALPGMCRSAFQQTASLSGTGDACCSSELWLFLIAAPGDRDAALPTVKSLSTASDIWTRSSPWRGRAHAFLVFLDPARRAQRAVGSVSAAMGRKRRLQLMCKFIHRLVLLVAMPLCLVAGVAQAATALEPIRFGSVAMDIPAQMHKRLTPLTNYLGKALGRPVILTLSPDMPTAIAQIVHGNVDLAYLTPVAYVSARASADTQIVVKTVTDNKGTFRLLVVVRNDSPLRSIEDLKGRSFAFGDEAALLQRAVVVGAGVPLETLSSYEFLGHYDNIIRAVLQRNFDAGILLDHAALKWQGKGIRTLYTSPDLPAYNITARQGMDGEVLLRVREALLRLDPKNPEHVPVIRSLAETCNGFEAAEDAEYDVVRRLIAPFQMVAE